MFTYNLNDYTFNMYDMNTESDYIEQFSINQLQVENFVGNYIIPLDQISSGLFIIPIVNSSQKTINCFYTLKQTKTHVVVANRLKEENVKTVFNHVLRDYLLVYLKGSTNWNNDTTELSVLKYCSLPMLDHSQGIMYAIETSTMFESIKQNLPSPICKYYSDPSIKLYSKEYLYANDTHKPNCSQPTMVANSAGSAVSCPYNFHSECPVSEKNEIQVRLDYFYNNLIQTQQNKYQLTKTHFSDLSIHYIVAINDIVHSELIYPKDKIESFDNIDDEAVKVYEQIIKETSNLVQTDSLNEIESSSKNSYLKNFIVNEQL
jgi:hypothetical protein